MGWIRDNLNKLQLEFGGLIVHWVNLM